MYHCDSDFTYGPCTGHNNLELPEIPYFAIMDLIKFKQKGKPDIEVTKEDLLINVLELLRSEYANRECIIYEIQKNGKETIEGPAALLVLLKNPEMVNTYSEIIKRENQWK
jgi:hypothetical protein